MSDFIYLFCLARSCALPAIEGAGVDGQSPLFLMGFLDICAVLSTISPEELCGPLAESRMKDLAWLGPRACRHEEVVMRVMRHSPVLPTRFGTIFSSLESLKKLLQKHYAVISRFLDHMADKEEWAVKGMLDREKAVRELLSMILARERESLDSLSPGMRYFHQQKIQAAGKKELTRWLKDLRKGIADDLSNYASDFFERKVLSNNVTGRGMEMVLNWAYLVPRGAVAEFLARIDRGNSDHACFGISLEYSGPWPPYSFCPNLEMEKGA